jgi:toxin ParE1/3/4
MGNYHLTRKAIEDLSNIWIYTFNHWSEYQADTYYQMLIESFDKISQNPDIGKNYSGIIKSVFGFKTGRHIVFYRNIDNKGVEIVRILHERMDLKYRILEKW